MTGKDTVNLDKIPPVMLVLQRLRDFNELPNFWKIFRRTMSVIFELPGRLMVPKLELQLFSRARMDSSGIYSKSYNSSVVRRVDRIL